MLNIVSAQLNFTVGDIEGNIAKIINSYEKAKKLNADIVIFSELAITGYPAEDLVLFPEFQKQAMAANNILARLTKQGPALIIGNICLENNKLYNSALFFAEGEILQISHKNHLPNYGVFDEKRTFSCGTHYCIISYKGINFAIIICEDLWSDELPLHLKKQGANIIIAINASPFDREKQQLRYTIAKNCTKLTHLPLIYVNQVGGQDELVFDGGSFILDHHCNLIKQQPYWLEDISFTCWKLEEDKLISQDKIANIKLYEDDSQEFHIYEAMKLALRDYVEKNNFPHVIIGMSGGIDSALTAAIAVDALGSNRVKLFMLPYIYTSNSSIDDATKCATLLNIDLEIIDIAPVVNSIYSNLSPLFTGTSKDLTEENIQSRVRGLILMAISNKFGGLLLTTGNKSEIAVGYATIYGDMCGGYNVLKDLYKTQVYQIAKWRNKSSLVIAQNILIKPASAELRENQTDQDSLPEYEILDNILYLLVDKKLSCHETASKLGIELELVAQIEKLVLRSEYKRSQAAIGVKISNLSFGRDRRYPITNKFTSTASKLDK